MSMSKNSDNKKDHNSGGNNSNERNKSNGGISTHETKTWNGDRGNSNIVPDKKSLNSGNTNKKD